MEYIGQQLCISAPELMSFMSESSYKLMLHRNREIIKAQRSCRGKSAMIVIDTLPDRVKDKVKELYPDGSRMQLHEIFRRQYELDAEARTELSRYRFDNGKPLPPPKIHEYTINASVIRAVLRLMSNANSLRKATPGGKVTWDEISAAVSYFKQEFGHTLPESTLRFRKAVSRFKKEGYESLISGKFRNQNSRKVNDKIVQLLLSIAVQPEKPYNTTTAEMYNQFICGELDVYNMQTGELYDPEDFTDPETGEPIALSETTIANYLNNPKNKVIISHETMTAYDFNNAHRPHHHRHSPYFSFSKISLDDRDLPRKLTDGNRLKAYYAYDVASGCVIGYAYSRNKTKDLFIDCVRNMFQTIDVNGWNCPAEVEVERHLVSEFKDTLMKANMVFPFVRWCNPTNSQEKRAEHFNKVKKYGVEKRMQVGIGRWWAKLETNQTRTEKIYDEFNDNYKDARYDIKELIADDIAAINKYNNQLHPNQKYYPGKTRWDVLRDNQNPNLTPVEKALLYRYIGEQTQTTIRRNMYCTVCGIKFRLPTPECIAELEPRNYTVKAYYMPDSDGNVSEVYLYQHDNYIATCAALTTYNEAKIEQTDLDVQAYQEQAAYVAQFDSMIRKEKVERVGIMDKQLYEEDIPVETIAEELDLAKEPEDYFDEGYNYSLKALEDL